MSSGSGKSYGIKTERPTIGVIPAAGYGRRLPGLTTSKELYPISTWRFPGEESIRPGAVIEHVLSSMYLAKISQAVVTTRRDKPDIPAHLDSIARPIPSITYRFLDSSPSLAHSIAAAIENREGFDMVLGLPDILFRPDNTFECLLNRWRERNCDVLLTLAPTDRAEKSDMVELDKNQRVLKIHVKQAACRCSYAWINGVWGSQFCDFLISYLEELTLRVSSESVPTDLRDELQLGWIFQMAIEEGLRVEGLRLENGRFIDIGTPDDAARIARFSDIEN